MVLTRRVLARLVVAILLATLLPLVFPGAATASVPLAITSASQATFAVGRPATFTLTATRSLKPVLTAAGALPDGIEFDDRRDGTATLSGTPRTTGTYPLTISAQDTAGRTAEQRLLLSVGEGWYNVSWQRRKPITIDHTQVGSALTNYPVKIMRYSDSDLAARAQSDGDDILFTNSDGTTKLNHQLVSYTSAAGDLVVWVQVPTLSSTTDTTLYMYYGNSSASSQQNASATWDSTNTSVWHLTESVSTATGNFKDSTGNANHATYQGSPGLTTNTDGGLTFNGTSNYLSTANQQTNPQVLSVEAWVKTSSASGKPIVNYEGVQTGTSTGLYDRTLNIGTDGRAHFAVWDGSAARQVQGGTNLADGNWHFLVGTYSNVSDVLTLYVDGAAASSMSGVLSAEVSNGWWRVGSYHASDNTFGANGYFPGTVDEVRVANTVRSAGWVTTNYNNQNNPFTFSSVGAEQTVTAPAITSANSTSFTENSAGSFTVTTTGAPTPTLSKTGTLPTGVTFVDNGNGTATLSGTPTSTGTYPLTITAANGVAPNATQNFTLTVGAAWYNTGWLYRKAITIDHTKVSANTTNFTVLVSRADADLAAHAHSTGRDILFTDSDKVTKLSHEIESYTSASGTLVAWVQVPSLSSTVSKTIYLYYGNATAGDQQNVSGTWRSEYKGVWHLSQSPTVAAPQFRDSTSNANHGTAQGSMPSGAQVAGKVNGSITLNPTATSHYISTAVLQTNPQVFTVEAWVKTNVASGKAIVNFEDIQTGSAATNNYDRSLYVGTDGRPRFVLWDGSAARIASGSSSIANDQWHHLAGSYNGSTMSLYVNGALVATAASSSAQVFNGYWRFGSYHETPYTNAADGYLPGTIDEIRVSNTAWPTSTITTRYNNQSSPSTFFSVAAEEGYTAAPTITSANNTTFATTLPRSFTVTTTGSPAPTLSVTGALPSGVTFVNNGNGTATLAGTPASTATGTYPLTITADNSVDPDATQSFTLTVVSGWYNSGWRYRKAITIDRTKVGATLTNFPFLVSRTDSDLAARAQSSGNDILFTSSDGVTKLDHQIETYTSGTGALVGWVEVPSLSTTADTVIYMYYGNASAADQQNAGAVWDSGFKGVWHLSEGPTSTAPQFRDSTGNTNHGTAQGSIAAGAQVAGKVDGSITLDGTSDYISTTNQATVPNTVTVEAWFKTTTASGKKIVGYASDQTGSAEANYDRMLWVGTDGKLRFGVYDGVLRIGASAGTVTDGAWHHAVGVYDNVAQTLTLYLDGAVASIVATGTTPQSYTGWWRIGSYMMYAGWTNSAAGYFPGSVDEVRVSNTARSAGWITTEYNSQSSPSTFSTTASEFVYTAPPAITSANSTTFTAGSAGTFTVTTTGVPTPALSKTGTLPTGVTFVDNGNGTATLSGTPAVAGSYPLTITASSSTTPNATQSFTLTVNGGSLSIALPSTANLGSGALGSTVSGALGSVQVIDNRGSNSASWTASVSSTTFAGAGKTIPLANLRYWSGPSTATTGTGTFTPGQNTSGAAQDLTTSRTCFTLASGNGINQATWNPTLMVTVPITLVPATYSGTVTHSVV
jgi:hypothetical protein